MKSNMPGFHYHGKDKRGVSKWEGGGNWQRILSYASVGMMIYGVCAGIAFLAILLYALLTLSWPAAFSALIFVTGTHALTFGGISVWMRQMKRHISSLDTADQLSARFGVNEETLATVAQDKNIKPRMNMNGVDYYNPADFAEDAMTLLRGTIRPNETPEVLLRPATANTSTASEQLLRVPSNNLEVSEAVQRVTSTSLTISHLSIETPTQDTMQELRQHG